MPSRVFTLDTKDEVRDPYGLFVCGGIMGVYRNAPLRSRRSLFLCVKLLGGCVGMVTAMANAYNELSEEERESVFLLAVGKDDYSFVNDNFCKGFAMCTDDPDDPWWTTWDAAQRDVFFYVKNNGDWEYYCRYSMNAGRNEFGNTIKEMLTIAATNTVEVEEDDSLGNETLIEDEDEPPFEAVQAVAGESLSYVSSSSTSSNFVLDFMLSAGVFGLLIA